MSEQPQPPSRPREPTGPDRRSLRSAAVLLIVGQVVYWVTTAGFHPDADDPVAAFVVYAGSRSWEVVHAVQFAGSVLFTFGLLALIQGLDVRSGLLGLVNRFAAATAVAGLAVNGALYAVDGVGLKQAVDTWVSGPPAARPALFAVVEGVRGIEWGLRGYVFYTGGLTLILLAVVIAATARVPRGIGYLTGLAGLLGIAHGVGYGGGYTAVSDHAQLNILVPPLFVLAWTIWLLVVAWRMPEPRTSEAAQPVRG